MIPNYPLRIHQIRKVCESTSILIGAFALLGWTSGIAHFKEVVPGFTSMNPLTAILIILGGIALKTRERDLSMFFSLAVITLSMIKGMSFTGMDLQIDQIFFSGSLGSNRMSPHAASILFTIGIGLLSLRSDSRRAVWVSQISATVSMTLSFMALVGYLYNVQPFYGISDYIPIALNTVVALLLLSIGMLCARSDEGWILVLGRKDSGGNLSRGIFPYVIVVPLIVGWLTLEGMKRQVFTPSFGAALIVTLCIVILSFLIHHIAEKLSTKDRAYRKQTKTLQLILDGIGEGVAVADTSGKFTLFNPAATKLTGVGVTPAPADEWPDHFGIFRSDRKTRYKPEELPLSLALKGMETDQVVMYLRNEKIPEGIFVEANGRPLRSDAGEVVGGVVVFRDISNQKEATEILEKSHAQLKEKTFEQNIQLKRSEAQIRQLQKMDAVGRLAGGMANHFDQKQTLELDPLSLNDLITGFKKSLDRLIGEKIQLITKLQSDLHSVRVDPRQIEQVLMTLVMNAKDAMPYGGTVVLSTRNAQVDEEFSKTHMGLRPGNYVQMSVNDTGVGMSEEIQSKIFEPFFSTKPTGSGTGLGLTAAYEIMKQHQGGIWVYSELGHGTTFKVYLPTAS